jgi:hypothetical protein
MDSLLLYKQNQTDDVQFNNNDDSLSTRTVLNMSGIDMPDLGRSCSKHPCCGNVVGTGDILFLPSCRQSIIGVDKHVVKVFKVNPITGLAGCHVGYLPGRYLALHYIEVFNKVYLHVKKDYRSNKLKMNRNKSIRNHGLVSGHIITN